MNQENRNKIAIIGHTRGIGRAIADLYKSKQENLLKKAEEEASKTETSDQSKYLADQKVQVLRSIN